MDSDEYVSPADDAYFSQKTTLSKNYKKKEAVSGKKLKPSVYRSESCPTNSLSIPFCVFSAILCNCSRQQLACHTPWSVVWIHHFFSADLAFTLATYDPTSFSFGLGRTIFFFYCFTILQVVDYSSKLTIRLGHVC